MGARRLLGTSEIAVLLSASEASVKRWADSGALPCERTPGGHRRFDPLVVRSFAERLRAPLAPPSAPTAPADLATCALAADMTSVAEAFAAFGTSAREIARAADELIAPTLSLIGERWAKGQLSTADEHLASDTLRVVATARLAAAAVPPRGDRLALVACLGEEEHDFGALLVGLALRADGFRVRRTGARTPVADAVRMARELRFDVVALSFSLSSDPGLAQASVAALAKAASKEAALFVGGGGLARLKLVAPARPTATVGLLLDALD